MADSVTIGDLIADNVRLKLELDLAKAEIEHLRMDCQRCAWHGTSGRTQEHDKPTQQNDRTPALDG